MGNPYWIRALRTGDMADIAYRLLQQRQFNSNRKIDVTDISTVSNKTSFEGTQNKKVVMVYGEWVFLY